jgi:hypothetical protein
MAAWLVAVAFTHAWLVAKPPAGGLCRAVSPFRGNWNLTPIFYAIFYAAANPIPASRLVLIARRSQPAHSLAEVLLARQQRHATTSRAKPRAGGLCRAIRAVQGSPRRWWTDLRRARGQRAGYSEARGLTTVSPKAQVRSPAPASRLAKGAKRADRAAQPARTRLRCQPSRRETVAWQTRRDGSRVKPGMTATFCRPRSGLSAATSRRPSPAAAGGRP